MRGNEYVWGYNVENLDRAGMVQTNLWWELHFVAWLVLSKAQTPPMAMNSIESDILANNACNAG